MHRVHSHSAEGCRNPSSENVHPLPGYGRFVVTDEELLRRIAGRDERAFAQLYERHFVTARATARRVCPDLADDALQDAFFALWRDASAFQPRSGGAAGWLHTIVRNRGLDLRRQAAVRERRCGPSDTEGVSAWPGPDAVVAGREERARVRAAVDGLPAPQREVVLLAYVEELTPDGDRRAAVGRARHREGPEPPRAAPLGARAHCLSTSPRSNGCGWSSCANPQLAGSRSGRQRTNCGGCRKRAPSR